MIVIDASVAVKWFLNEELSDQAVTVLTLDRKLFGPTLAVYEVAGAIVRALRRNDIDAEEAASCQNRWLHSVNTNVLRLEHDDRDIVRASTIAAAFAHPLADCVYLAMAERLDAPLVTADSVFHQKSGKGHQVLHLRDIHQLVSVESSIN